MQAHDLPCICLIDEPSNRIRPIAKLLVGQLCRTVLDRHGARIAINDQVEALDEPRPHLSVDALRLHRSRR